MPLDMISSGGKEAKHMTNMLIRGCTMGRTRCLVDNNKKSKKMKKIIGRPIYLLYKMLLDINDMEVGQEIKE